jgi:hypothetical protein
MWNLRVGPRLAEWRLLRADISELDISDACNTVNTLWSKAPLSTGRLLDPEDPSSWPTPWELLAENEFCDLSKALGITYTLYLSSHNYSDLELCIYSDGEEYRHIVLVDAGDYVLNFEPFKVVNITHERLDFTNLQMLHRYSPCDLSLDKY